MDSSRERGLPILPSLSSLLLLLLPFLVSLLLVLLPVLLLLLLVLLLLVLRVDGIVRPILGL